MSNTHDESPVADGFAGFGKFVPGFDFLQNLVTQTAASAAKTTSLGGSSSGLQMPGLGGWIAPTMNVEELDRRIKELKAVQFWLDQNATALKATVTALEVQKMTLATLKDMNFNMNEVASAFKAKATESFASMAPAAPEPQQPAEPAAVKEAPDAPEKDPAPAASGVDPMQWWGALTQQFQTIAADAMKDVARQAAQVAPQKAKSRRAAPAAKSPARAKPAAQRAAPVAAKSGRAAPARAPAKKAAARPARKSAR